MSQNTYKNGKAAVSSSVVSKYREALQNLPVPNGNGCHQAILGVSNYGVFSKLTSSQIYDDIRSRLSELGGRKVPDREINAAIQRAFNDADKDWKPIHRPQFNGPKIRETIAKANTMTEADLWESSPIKLLDDVQGDSILLLQAVYEPADLLFIGGREEPGILGKTIRSADEWISHFAAGGKSAEHIIPNPLNGVPGECKSGEGLTLRGDNNVSKFKFIVVEFDGLPREEQLSFFVKSRLPVCCLIDSGGKSIHGWVQVNGIENTEGWEKVVRERLFPQMLVPMGVDSACKNESRLSRLPGHYRKEKEKWQRLLWLSPQGRRLQP